MKRRVEANLNRVNANTNTNTNTNRTAKRGRTNAGPNVNVNVNAPAPAVAAAAAAPAPLQMVVYKAPEDIARGAIGGDHAAYLQLVKSADREIKALVHFHDTDSMAKGFQMAARPTDPSVREVIIQQEFVSKAANKSYLFVLHLLEDVEAIKYTPPASELLIKKFLGHYVPGTHYDYSNIRTAVESLLNEEQVAGDRCAGALMNTLPYILAAYGTIKYFATSGKFHDNLVAIHKDVESTLRAVRIYKKTVDDKAAKNATYNQRLIELQGRVMGGLNQKKGITATPFPPRAPLGGGKNAIGSQLEGVVPTTDSFIFGTGKKVNITGHLPQIYALINFLAMMFPEIALKCYMVLPDNDHLTDIPSFYPQFEEQSYSEAMGYFTAGAVMSDERKKAIEHIMEDDAGDAADGAAADEGAKCSKVDLENRLSQLGETMDVPFLKKVVTKLFDLGCYVGNSFRSMAPTPAIPAIVAAGVIAEEARDEIARVEKEVIAAPAPSPAPAVAAAAAAPGEEEAAEAESEDASAAAATLLSMIGPVGSTDAAANANANANSNLSGGYRMNKSKSKSKSKSRKSTRRRITRNRKKNLRSTRSSSSFRFRLSRKFL